MLFSYLEGFVSIALQKELLRREAKNGLLSDTEIRTLAELALEIVKYGVNNPIDDMRKDELVAEAAPDILEQINRVVEDRFNRSQFE